MASHARIPKSNASRVVGFLLESQSAAIVHVVKELVWVASTQFRERSFDLLLLDVVIFFVLASAGKSLPWQLALNQIQKDVTNGFQIVASALLHAFVCVDGGVSSSASQVLTVLVGDVHTLTIHVALGQTEINDVDVVAGRVVASNKEIVWLDVSVDYALLMDHLDAVN
jgi:hypothetical protein